MVLPIQLSNISHIAIENLKQQLQALVSAKQTNANETIITNLRHYNALCDANEALQNVQYGLQNATTSDILAIDIKKALHALGEISGEISNDEVLGNIFGKFCIGK